MTETSEFEIIDIAAEDAAEDVMCKEICATADYIDGLVDEFLDVHPAKALAFVTHLKAAAQEFMREEFVKTFEVSTDGPEL